MFWKTTILLVLGIGIFLQSNEHSLVAGSSSSVTPQQEPPQKYQVTGQLTSLTDNKITILKDRDTWQISRQPNTTMLGEVKVGSRVSVQYIVNATTVEARPEVTPIAGATKPKSKQELKKKENRSESDSTSENERKSGATRSSSEKESSRPQKASPRKGTRHRKVVDSDPVE